MTEQRDDDYREPTEEELAYLMATMSDPAFPLSRYDAWAIWHRQHGYNVDDDQTPQLTETRQEAS